MTRGSRARYGIMVITGHLPGCTYIIYSCNLILHREQTIRIVMCSFVAYLCIGTSFRDCLNVQFVEKSKTKIRVQLALTYRNVLRVQRRIGFLFSDTIQPSTYVHNGCTLEFHFLFFFWLFCFLRCVLWLLLRCS